jgi:hypothetical protein
MAKAGKHVIISSQSSFNASTPCELLQGAPPVLRVFL